MFLTRLGFSSKMVITGDPSQVDLPKGVKSGLSIVANILSGVSGLSFITLEQTDVVRHPLVQRIIEAYDKMERSYLSDHFFLYKVGERHIFTIMKDKENKL